MSPKLIAGFVVGALACSPATPPSSNPAPDIPPAGNITEPAPSSDTGDEPTSSTTAGLSDSSPTTTVGDATDVDASETTQLAGDLFGPKQTTGPTFSVRARLVDRGHSVPHCGVLHIKLVMKFEVEEVITGHLDDSELYVGVSCPEMPPTKTRGFRWTEGVTYTLKLRSAGLRRSGALVDPFKKEPGKRYELLQIDPIAEPVTTEAKKPSNACTDGARLDSGCTCNGNVCVDICCVDSACSRGPNGWTKCIRVRR